MTVPTEFDNLFDTVRRAKDAPPEDLAAALAAEPEVGHLPSLWLTWTLIVFAVTQRLQRWGKTLVWGHVLTNLPPMDELAVEVDQPVEGIVPGWPEWEYEIEAAFGYGYLRHEPTDRSIMLNLAHPSAEDYLLVPMFMMWFGAVQPGSAEERLRQLHPSDTTVELSVKWLVAAGMLGTVEYCDGCYAHRLAGAALEHAEALADFGEAWARAVGHERIWLAGLVGDWMAAHEAAVALGDPATIALTQRRMEACREERISRIRAELVDEGLVPTITLFAFREAGGEVSPDRLREGLQGHGREAKGAMWWVEQLDDPAYCTEVRQLYDRVRSGCEGRDRELAASCARFLARHGHATAAMIMSIHEYLPNTGEAILVALEHMPDRALPVIRHALRPPEGGAGENVATMLALIDRPWSRAELLSILGESASPEETMFVRAALRESSDQAARLAVDHWEESHPVAKPENASKTPGFISDPTQSLQRNMARLRDRIMPLRDCTPGPASMVTADQPHIHPSENLHRAETGKAPESPIAGPSDDGEASSGLATAGVQSGAVTTALDMAGDGNTDGRSQALPQPAWRYRLEARRRHQEVDVQ